MAWEACGRINPFETCLSCMKSNENVHVFEQIKGGIIPRYHYIQKCSECGCIAEFFKDEEAGQYYCDIFQITDGSEEESGDQTLN